MRKALGLCLLLTSVIAMAAPRAQLRDIRVWAGPDQTRVVFDLSGPVTHQIEVIENPHRVVIDITGAGRGEDLAHVFGKGVIEGVRTGVHPGGKLRIVLDVNARVVPHAFDLPPNTEYGHRLVVDLEDPNALLDDFADLIPRTTTASAPPPASAPGAAWPPTAPSVPAPQRPVPSAPIKSAPPVVANAPVVTTPPAIKTPPVTATPPAGRNNRPIVIAVDAGHGGEDPGARGPNGTREKDVALAIARKLAKMINGEPGMKAVLTRDGDYYIGLRQRTAKARRAQADLFVSIHADAFPDRSATGSSVYVVSQRGASSEHARALAERENAADLVGGVRLTGRDDRDSFLLSVLQDTSMEASFDVAGRLLRELRKVNNLHKHDVQQAGFMVLKSPDIPSVLVETAFISNRGEEQLLRDDGYRDDLAEALLRGLRGYFSNYRPGRTLAEADIEMGNPR
jgi:N-acetylmuramoyl-L-alanine amidase